MNITALEKKAMGRYKSFVANDVVKAGFVFFGTTLMAALYDFFFTHKGLPTAAEFKTQLLTAAFATGSYLFKKLLHQQRRADVQKREHKCIGSAGCRCAETQ